MPTVDQYYIIHNFSMLSYCALLLPEYPKALIRISGQWFRKIILFHVLCCSGTCLALSIFLTNIAGQTQSTWRMSGGLLALGMLLPPLPASFKQPCNSRLQTVGWNNEMRIRRRSTTVMKGKGEAMKGLQHVKQVLKRHDVFSWWWSDGLRAWARARQSPQQPKPL